MKRFCVSGYRRPGMTDNEVIEACFFAARGEEAREIIFDEPEYRLSRSVLIPSDTTVVLDGCLVKQEDGTFDTAFCGDNLTWDPTGTSYFPTEVRDLRNVKLVGRNGARVEGPDRNDHDFHPGMVQIQEKVGDFWGWRTLTAAFAKCKGLEIGGISFSKTRCYCVSLEMCENVHLHDLRIDSNIKNGDGIDVLFGCHHVLIENITGCTSDDNIALSAVFLEGKEISYPNEKSVYPMTVLPSFGHRPAWERDISDVTVRNCRIGGLHHGVICLATGGCQVYDVHIENIEETGVGPWKNPYLQATVKIYTGYGDGYTAGDLHDITVKNLVSRDAETPVYVKAEVKDILLENVVSEKGNPLRLPDSGGITVR